MEEPKILGVAELPNEEDVRSGRMHEDSSSMQALHTLIRNPEKTNLAADLLAYPPLSQKLRELSALEVLSDEYEGVLMEAFDLRDRCNELEQKTVGPAKEAFRKDLFAYLDKLNIEYSKEDLARRSYDVMINFLDYVRYFGNAINLDVDLEEACGMSGYYLADSHSISINLSAIDGLVASSAVAQDETEAVQTEAINSTLRHELIHALSYQNFWVTENEEDGGEQTDSRRVGIKSLSFDRSKMRLMLLNEAVTEKLNQETRSAFLPKEDKETLSTFVSYEKEIEILNTLCQFVDWKVFVSACFSKHGLLKLGKELKAKTGLTLTELDNAMMADHQEGYKNNLTINLVKTQSA